MASKNHITIEDIDNYEKLSQQLRNLHTDISALSKKSPDGPINKFKLNIINKKLESANKLLTSKFTPLEDFEKFDEDNLPTNSDVVLVLSQYIEAFDAWREAHIYAKSYSWFWKTKDQSIEAISPGSTYRAGRKLNE